MSNSAFETIRSLLPALSTVEKLRLIEELAAALANELAVIHPAPKRSLLGAYADISDSSIVEATDESKSNVV